MLATCPRTESLIAWMDCPGTPSGPPDLVAHLQTCDACLAKLETLAGNIDGLPNIDFLKPSNQPGVLGRFGAYPIVEIVARGGMGIVLKAVDPTLERVVAIKVLDPGLASNPRSRLRFLREARAAAGIRHDHVVAIYSVDQVENLPYLVMPFVEGPSLEQRIESDGPLPLDQILDVGIQVASGLAAAHAQGLVHRDIKPSNLLFDTAAQRVVITDFGLAKAADESSVTRSGTIAGTPEYMSPEQARGEPVDHRTDLFSLGCVLYAMATGTPPFRTPSVIATLRKVCDDDPKPAHEVNPALPAWLGEIIQRLQAKHRNDRFASASDLVRLLQEHASRPQVKSSRPSTRSAVGKSPCKGRPDRTRKPLRAVCTALGAVTVLMGAAVANPGTPGTAGVVHSLLARCTAQRCFIPGRLWGFSSLSQAIQEARPRDTIELRFDGVLQTTSLSITNKPLTIRAASGFRPVIVCQWDRQPMLATDSALTLEGIEFQLKPPRDESTFAPSRWPLAGVQGRTTLVPLRKIRPAVDKSIVLAQSSPLWVTGCKFIFPSVAERSGRSERACVVAENSPHCELRSCEFYSFAASAIVWNADQPALSTSTNQRARLVVQNSIFASREIISIGPRPATQTLLELSNNTMVGATGLLFWGDAAGLPTQVTAAGNLFDLRSLIRATPMSGNAGITNLVAWTGDHNLFSIEVAFTDLPSSTPRQVRDLSVWNEVCTQRESDSIDLRLGMAQRLVRGANQPHTISPQSFRLSFDETRRIARLAGADSQFGATIDRTGPGAAYQALRQSPDDSTGQGGLQVAGVKSPVPM